MKISKLQQPLLDVIQHNNGLSLYLSGLQKGREGTPRSALYNLPEKGISATTEEVYSRWLDQLNALKEGSSFEQEVYQFDLHQAEKWGQQGKIAPVNELLDAVVTPTFSQPSDVNYSAFTTLNWDRAKKLVRAAISPYAHGLRPAAYQNVVDDMRARDTLESNSGWPSFTRRNKPEVVAQALDDARSGAWRNYPAIALFRNYRQKTRLVWMYPMATNLVEGSFVQPLQRAIMQATMNASQDRAPRLPELGFRASQRYFSHAVNVGPSFFAPWVSFDYVRRLISHRYTTGGFVAASDFSSTDAHFRKRATLEVFDVIAYCFQEQYRESLRESLEHMHDIPLIVNADTIIEGEHGVSSGSMWTNFVETIFDAVFAVYVHLAAWTNGHSLAHTGYSGLYAIGDDMSWYSPHFEPDFSERLEALGRNVGQVIKAEKTTNDRDKVISLQRLFQRGYLQDQGDTVRAVYPTVRALNSLVFPERMHRQRDWSKDMAAVRAVMILENCVDHPLYRQFVQYVAAGDPHLVEFAHQSAEAQTAAYRKSKLIPGLNATYNQERRESNITSFQTMQELAKL